VGPSKPLGFKYYTLPDETWLANVIHTLAPHHEIFEAYDAETPQRYVPPELI